MIQWIKRLFTSRTKKVPVRIELRNGTSYEELVDIHRFDQRTNEIQEHFKPQKSREEITFIWCLVGNIIDEHYLTEKKEVKRGTKHFSPDTKVYCFPARWGDGYENIMVIGRHRKSKRYVNLIMPAKYITNWRLQKVYRPYILNVMYSKKGWTDSEDDKKVILDLADILKAR